jgi:hypothetical protein
MKKTGGRITPELPADFSGIAIIDQAVEGIDKFIDFCFFII